MEKENILLLRKIYENSKTAVDTFGMIKKCPVSEDFGDFIEKQSYKYFHIAEDANMRLREFNCPPEEGDIWSKLGLAVTIRTGNKRTSRYARLLIDGCVGGVNDMIGEMKHSGKMDSDCLDLAHILIETEQETIAILQRFL